MKHHKRKPWASRARSSSESYLAIIEALPLSLPVQPAPKAQLKEGTLKDSEQHFELLGIVEACQGELPNTVGFA